MNGFIVSRLAALTPLDLIFPPRCVRCRAYLRGRAALCAACRRRMTAHRTFFCGKCRARRYSERGVCHRGFAFALAAGGEYADPALKALIHSLKFHFVRAAASELGRFLAGYCLRLGLHKDRPLILPVPLGRKRQRERGYNQSELIALMLARLTGMEVRTDILRRLRETPPQSGLRGPERRGANVAGCFAVTQTDAAAVKDRKVIVLDDVVTTGATMLEAALALRAAGARDVLALAAAKA